MIREQNNRRKKKIGRKKRQRNRRFWRRVTANRFERILEIARRLTRNASDSQDLAQTVVERLLKYCPKPVRIVNIDAYIYTSARNAWLDSQPSAKEISFSELEKTDASQIAALDPNLDLILLEYDLKILLGKTGSTDTKLLQTKILRQAGYKLPQIAGTLKEPVRRTRARWYSYRNSLQKVLRGVTSKNLTSSSKIH